MSRKKGYYIAYFFHFLLLKGFFWSVFVGRITYYLLIYLTSLSSFIIQITVSPYAFLIQFQCNI